MHPANKTCDLGNFVQIRVTEMLALGSQLQSLRKNTRGNGNTHIVSGAQEDFFMYMWYFPLKCDAQDCARLCFLYCSNSSFHNDNLMIRNN